MHCPQHSNLLIFLTMRKRRQAIHIKFHRILAPSFPTCRIDYKALCLLRKAKDGIVWTKCLRFLEELEMFIIGQRDTQLK